MNENLNIFIARLLRSGIAEQYAIPLTYGLVTLLVLLGALLTTWLVRRSLIRFIIHLIHSNRMKWDDALVKNNFFRQLSWFVPVAIFYVAQDLMLPPDSQWVELLRRLIICGFVLVGIGAINALLKSINDIYRSLRGSSGKTIRGYIDAIKIAVYLFGIVFLIGVLTGRSLMGLLSVMGGLTAVTMLVFRDSILGFIASIQLTGTDMIRVGDWIEMTSHGADGDVIEISIHSVRVRNWDKTITTIPTYALISKSFKNWRGMSESGGRRIKRSLHLDMTSIRFLSDTELDKLAKIHLLTDYIHTRQQEIEQYNLDNDIDSSVIINGRSQTNAGIFRAYMIAFLKQNPKIHKNMTFLVRQLEPGADGLPLQLYVFSNDQAWAKYEAIQADIFDHLIAALPEFDLRVFQQPSGYDFHGIGRER